MTQRFKAAARAAIEQLGEPVNYAPAGGGAGTNVYGIFRSGFREQLGMEAQGPSVACMAEDVPGIGHGAAFTIRGQAYKVVAVEPDLVRGDVTARLQRA